MPTTHISRDPVHGPLIVLVHGAPASGKSTVANRLAGALAMPVLSRDAIKETLADGGPKTADLTLLSGLSFDIFYRRITDMASTGQSLIAEQALMVGISEPDVAALLDVGDVVMVYCTAPVAVLRDRFLARIRSGDQHWCHRDQPQEESISTGTFDWSVYDPLALPFSQQHVVDTASEWDLAELAATILGGSYAS